MVEAIAEFKPQVLHTHYLVNLSLVAQLARKTGVPFTLRTHSFDVIPSPSRPVPEERLRDLAVLVEDDLCLGVLCFPFVRPELERLGFRPDKLHDCYPVLDYALFHDPSPNGEAVMNVGAGIAKKAMHEFVALASQVNGLTFNLYMSHQDEAEFRRIEALNRSSPNPVRLCSWVDHIDMPRQYKKHRWLVYTASREHRNVGWPVAIAEAQAAGVGVCMANIRPDLRTYVGEAGILYDSVQELADIVTKPPPEEMRAAGFEQARKSDIQRHKGVLTALWVPNLISHRGNRRQGQLQISLTGVTPTEMLCR